MIAPNEHTITVVAEGPLTVSMAMLKVNGHVISGAQPALAVWSNSTGTAVVFSNGHSRLLHIPQFRDCLIQDLLEFLDALPDGCGLILDRQAKRLSIFNREKDGPLKGAQRLVIQDASGPDMKD